MPSDSPSRRMLSARMMQPASMLVSMVEKLPDHAHRPEHVRHHLHQAPRARRAHGPGPGSLLSTSSTAVTSSGSRRYFVAVADDGVADAGGLRGGERRVHLAERAVSIRASGAGALAGSSLRPARRPPAGAGAGRGRSVQREEGPEAHEQPGAAAREAASLRFGWVVGSLGSWTVGAFSRSGVSVSLDFLRRAQLCRGVVASATWLRCCLLSEAARCAGDARTGSWGHARAPLSLVDRGGSPPTATPTGVAYR